MENPLFLQGNSLNYHAMARIVGIAGKIDRGKLMTKLRLTRLEKCLVLSFLLILALLIASLIKSVSFWTNGLCLTRACIEAAASIIKQIDERTSPCDNFYQFACGGLYNENFTIPEDEVNLWTAHLAQEKINYKLKILIERLNLSNLEDYRSKLATFYSLCVDREAVEWEGNRPLAAIVQELGGWPVLEKNWTSENFDLGDLLVRLRRLGFRHDIFTKITVAPHIFYHTYNVLYIGEAVLGLDDRSYYERGTNDSIMAEYREFMVSSAMLLGANDRTYVEEEMEKVLNLETELALLTKPRHDVVNIYNPMNLTDVQELMPSFNWTQYFNGILDPVAYVQDDTYTIVYVPKYLKDLNGLMERTDPRIMANYILWRVVMQSASLLSNEWALISREFYRLIDGRTSLKSRSKYCLSYVRKYLNIAASSVYVRSNPDDQGIPMMKLLVDYIKKAFIKMAKDAAWMDSETMATALNKTSSMRLYVGHPDELADVEKINEYHSQLSTFYNDTWFSAVLAARKWAADLEYAQIVGKNEKGVWDDYSNVVEVNAYYRHRENSVQFPLSILEATEVNSKHPMYLNFGRIGWIIGHEITHGFDDFGRHFDPEGEYSDWWTNQTRNQFESKSKCFVEQYSNFSIRETGEKIDGQKTLSENIADNGGLKEAYIAYQDYVRDHGKEDRLPGLDYSQEQLFFITSSKFYCGKWRLPSLSYMIKTDDHSPAMFRVIGTMSNMHEFAKAFSCPSNSPMNPDHKCSLW